MTHLMDIESNFHVKSKKNWTQQTEGTIHNQAY